MMLRAPQDLPLGRVVSFREGGLEGVGRDGAPLQVDRARYLRLDDTSIQSPRRAESVTVLCGVSESETVRTEIAVPLSTVRTVVNRPAPRDAFLLFSGFVCQSVTTSVHL